MIELMGFVRRLLPLRWDWSVDEAITKLSELGFVVHERLPGIIRGSSQGGQAQVNYNDLRVEAMYFVLEDSREGHPHASARAHFEGRFVSYAKKLEGMWGRPVFYGDRDHPRFPRVLAASWAAVWPVGHACVALVEVTDPTNEAHVLGLVIMPPQPWAPLTAPRFEVPANAAGSSDDPTRGSLLG